jgi:hypothetical protein
MYVTENIKTCKWHWKTTTIMNGKKEQRPRLSFFFFTHAGNELYAYAIFKYG